MFLADAGDRLRQGFEARSSAVPRLATVLTSTVERSEVPLPNEHTPFLDHLSLIVRRRKARRDFPDAESPSAPRPMAPRTSPLVPSRDPQALNAGTQLKAQVWTGQLTFVSTPLFNPRLTWSCVFFLRELELNPG